MTTKLTCKICGHKSGNLVPHIESAHADTGLAAYMEAHGGLDAVVHPDLRAATTGGAPTLAFTLCGVECAKVTATDAFKSLVPAGSGDKYQFQEDITKDVIMDINEKKPIMLIGHTGCGKTSLIDELAARFTAPLLRVNTNQQTTVSDFIGFWTVKGGETVWVDGALPYAMRHGLWLLVDEIDYAEPAILAALHAVLEPNGALVLKEKGNEIVTRHPNFRIFATGNAVGQFSRFRHLYIGCNVMNAAFLNRWAAYIIPYLSEAQEEQALVKAVPAMPARLAKELVKVAAQARRAFEEETLSYPFSTRALIDWARGIVRHRTLKGEAPVRAAQSVLFAKMSREDAVTLEGFIRRLLGARQES